MGTHHKRHHKKHSGGNADSECNWVGFYVTNGLSPKEQDGQICFAYTLSDDDQTLYAGASLLYAPDNHPTPPNNPRTLFTTATDIQANADGTFTIPSVVYSNADKVHIPRVGKTGGDYNTLANLVFNPANDTITGRFFEAGPANPDPCDWESDVGN